LQNDLSSPSITFSVI